MELDAMIQEYLEYGMSRQLRKKTLHSYEQALRMFSVWLAKEAGIHEVEQIREATIRKYVLSLQTRGKYTACSVGGTEEINHPSHRMDYGKTMSNLTINNYLRNLRGFFSWLVEMEYIGKSPMRRIKMLPHQRTGKAYLTDGEVKALLAVLDREKFSEYRDYVVLMLMLDSGTRLGETLSVETEQLDLAARTLTLPADKTKGRKERTVFFSQRTAKELRRWFRFRAEQGGHSAYAVPVQRSEDMLGVRNYEANFRKYLRRTQTNKPVSPHTMRNNFAHRCLMSGMDIYTLSRILGHSSVTVTEKAYLDVKDEELKGKYARFSPMDAIYWGKN